MSYSSRSITCCCCSRRSTSYDAPAPVSGYATGCRSTRLSPCPPAAPAGQGSALLPDGQSSTGSPAGSRGSRYRRLTEVHLVHVQLKNTILAVAGIHQHGHVRFVGFTPVRALAGEEQVFTSCWVRVLAPAPYARRSGSPVPHDQWSKG